MLSFEDSVDEEMGEILSGEFSISVFLEIGVASATLDCIYNKTFLEIDAQGLPVQSNSPAFGIDKDAADTALGTELIEGADSYATVKGVRYKINKVEPDGTNYAQVFLQLPPN